ncbi:putative VRR-NUC domain, fanconi-associated nuclease 1 [Plasmopara halstedii]
MDAEFNEEHVPEEVASPWEDAYARHLNLVLTTIIIKREDFRELFSMEEIAIVTQFLSNFKPFEQQVYARLLQRQGPWFKTISLFRYFDQSEQPINNRKVQDLVHGLIDAGFLQQFPITSMAKHQSPSRESDIVDAALGAIKRCATASELAALYFKMTGDKKHIPKTDLMAAVKKVVKTQRRINGSRIPVAELMQQIWVKSYPLIGKESSDVMVLRMTAAIRDLMMRIHRLFYFVSTPPYNPMSSMPSQVVDTGQLIALATHKLRYEPTQWPGLMVFVKKVAYPDYHIPSNDDFTAKTLHYHRIFPSAEAYASYEVAYQLHRIMNVIEQCLQIVTPDKEFREPDLELKWVLSDVPPAFLAFQRLLTVIYEDEESTETEDDCILHDKLEKGAAESWQMHSWELFYNDIEKLQSLDDFVLATRSCLQAYMKWMKAAAYRTSGIPIFFSKCNAGYHLVRTLHIAVDLYEKMRKYQIATLLLNDLLAAPFLDRKRGYWWDRLAMNLEHLKCIDQARDACANALADPLVLAADRITLERRRCRLDRQDERKRAELNSADNRIPQSTGNSNLSPSIDVDKDDDDNTIRPKMHEYRKNHIVGRPLNRQTGEKSRFVGYDDEPCTVEQVVLQYYRDHHRETVDGEVEEMWSVGGWYGVHSEGLIFGNLFGILMWDILYANVPDVFQTPFQSAPLDFGYAGIFYETRRDLIERRLDLVANGWTIEELLVLFVTRWNAEFGKVSRFVRWPNDDVPSLQFYLLAIIAIGRPQLVNLLRYMTTSKEYHQAQNGLPDLFLMRIELCKDVVISWPTDSHGCLNIFAFCGMDEELNLNEKIPAAADSQNAERSDMTVSGDDLELQPLQHVLDLMKTESFAAHVKVVEVKGPRDRLSDKQLLWLDVLSTQVGLDASVMHVEEPEKRNKRKAKERAKASAKPAKSKRRKS